MSSDLNIDARFCGPPDCGSASGWRKLAKLARRAA